MSTKYCRPQPEEWRKRFPDDFFEHIHRLLGWPPRNQPGRAPASPPYVGKLINRLVYGPMAPGLAAYLSQRNPPRPPKGRRADHHHTFLNEEGEVALEARIEALVAMMAQAANWAEFESLLAQAPPSD